ncbi:MAG: hypothetical protein BMS9Abin03_168 [Thermodesulfobacteriota bacterium]|nr:MAG: hypothetical protein BMS9Abin03_168 [Thermodesulfobacteriota bacterium]
MHLRSWGISNVIKWQLKRFRGKIESTILVYDKIQSILRNAGLHIFLCMDTHNFVQHETIHDLLT